MNLILWRHAEAHPGEPDMARELTKKGHRQAEAVAEWLKPFLPHHVRILCSPAARTRQTADALRMRYELCDDLIPDADEAQILEACRWPGENETIIVVGHQPTLGRAASLIMTEASSDWALKKGSLWWFMHRVRQGDTQTVLKAGMSPDLLGVK